MADNRTAGVLAEEMNCFIMGLQDELRSLARGLVSSLFKALVRFLVRIAIRTGSSYRRPDGGGGVSSWSW